MRIRVHEQDAPAWVALRGIASLELFVDPGTSPKQQEVALLRWHREHLKTLIPPLLSKWQPVIGVQAAATHQFSNRFSICAACFANESSLIKCA